MYNKATKEYQLEKAEETAANAKLLIQHLNIASIRQFGEVIGAAESSVSRWIRKTGDQGIQPCYFFWLIYEAFGMFGLEVLFTGKVHREQGIEKIIKKMTIEEALDAQRSIIGHIETLSKRNTAS